ncbi:MAG: tetratricopeptide repeat protein, partial [Roseibacillus sp.]|nr:tetratricopeptide repeat protein [Roseibacillus sp.]
MANRTEHYRKGLQLYGENKHEEAIEEYRAALVEDPDWTEALHGLSMAQMHAGKLEEAVKTGLKIVEIDKGDAFAHTSLSMFYMRMGNVEEAENEAAKARMISWKEELKSNPDAAPPGPAGKIPI